MTQLLRKKKLVAGTIVISLVLLDQLSKYIIRQNGGFYICNKGVGFGISGSYLIILGLLFIFLAWQQKKKIKTFLINNKFLGALIISGALSNLIDRLAFGCVIDFINLKFWPLFNLADIFISGGVIILILKKIKQK